MRKVKNLKQVKQLKNVKVLNKNQKTKLKGGNDTVIIIDEDLV